MHEEEAICQVRTPKVPQASMRPHVIIMSYHFLLGGAHVVCVKAWHDRVQQLEIIGQIQILKYNEYLSLMMPTDIHTHQGMAWQYHVILSFLKTWSRYAVHKDISLSCHSFTKHLASLKPPLCANQWGKTARK